MSADADGGPPPSAVGRAKRPLTVLAGPYGHPFHPLLVTVPIGAWVTSFVLDVASRWSPDPAALATGGRWLIGIGVLGAVVAAGVGFLDLAAIATGTRAWRLAVTHMALNLTVTALFTVSFLLRGEGGPVGWGLVALSGLALVLLAAAGWLGGMLTYRYGVRVADETTQQTGFERTKDASWRSPPS